MIFRSILAETLTGRVSPAGFSVFQSFRSRSASASSAAVMIVR